MKYIVNRCYGGASIKGELAKSLCTDSIFDFNRADERLIRMIEEQGTDAVSGMSARLEVVNIPDEATDWMLDEYDGAESIIYVVNGKLRRI